jgi:hypothetical protein
MGMAAALVHWRPSIMWRGAFTVRRGNLLVGEEPELLGSRYPGCPIAGEAYDVFLHWLRSNGRQPPDV